MKKIIPLILITLASCQSENSSKNKTEDEKKDSTTSEKHHHEEEGHHHGEANHYMNQRSMSELSAHFESQERIDYQQPDKVLDYLGDLKDLKIMDIGSGTGFFSFRLAERGAHVIAADVSDEFQNYIQHKKDSLNIGDDKITLRKLSYDSPLLEKEEVDMVIIVNTYHHIENRADYFSKVKNGLKKGGRLVIIDFKKEELPVGPPLKMKLSPEEIIAELKECGLGKTKLNEEMLEYQYIIEFAPLK